MGGADDSEAEEMIRFFPEPEDDGSVTEQGRWRFPPPLSLSLFLSLSACVRACVCYIERGNNCKIKANWPPISVLLESRSRKLQMDVKMVFKTIIKASFASCERTWTLRVRGQEGINRSAVGICCGAPTAAEDGRTFPSRCQCPWCRDERSLTRM